MNDVDIVLPWVNGQEKDWNEKKIDILPMQMNFN